MPNASFQASTFNNPARKWDLLSQKTTGFFFRLTHGLSGFLGPSRKNSIDFCSSPDFGEFQFVQTAFATPHTLRLAFMLEHIERRNPEERGDSRITAEFAFHINSLLIGT